LLRALPTSLGCLQLLLILVKCLVHLPAFLIIHLFKLSKVAFIRVELEIVQVDDVSGDGVEQIPIVGDHYQSLLPSLKVLLKP